MGKESHQVPCIRGTAFQRAVIDLHNQVAAAPETRACTVERLAAFDFDVFTSTINAGGWYPIDLYGELLELLLGERTGTERRAYLRRRGRESAAALVKGRYEPLSDDDLADGKSMGHTLVVLGGAIYNFGSWEFNRRKPRTNHVLRFNDSLAMPDSGRLTAEGFIEALADRSTAKQAKVTSERHGNDLVFYLTLT